MEVALSIDLLKENVRKKYDYDERRIVGIILARYGTRMAKNLVSDCYQYWNLNTGKYLDIFWAGYGAYLCPDEQSSTKTILDFKGNKNRVYFDLEAFVSIKNEFKQLHDKIYKDKDHIELIFANYYDGQIHFEESFKIDLEKKFDKNYSKIRELIELITGECKSKYNIKSLKRKLKTKKILDSVKEIKFTDIANLKAFLKI
ncbi:hypothetical protein [Clostridium oceanicum]|uniref:Uncharacterized protein n=1 Tax=Clostridium oceanicum TaxID=1543 RepID=A0ABP3URR0_9CLOT